MQCGQRCLLLFAVFSMRSIGAAELSELARTLEKAAEGEDVALIRQKHGELIERYGKLASDLRGAVV